jgi:hypothetical protein
MAQENKNQYKCFFTYREATAGTADTNCFFECHGMMTKPPTTYNFISDKGKLGTGEFGNKQKVAAGWVTWSYKTSVLSEILFLLSYFQGSSYGVSTSGDLERHELFHLSTATTTLPTFTMQYGTGGTGNNAVYTGCVVNEFSIPFANSPTGEAEATFSGFANSLSYAGGFTLNTVGDMDTADAAFSFSTEPCLNYRNLSVWMADSVQTNLKGSCVDFAAHDLGANLQTLSPLINSITVGGTNGMSPENLARPGGGGAINTFERSDKNYTVEIDWRKDTSILNTDTTIIADTQRALEVQYAGKYISGTDPYGLDMFFPVVQFNDSPEGEENPVNQSSTLSVFQDSNGTACDIFGQTEVGTPYNALFS